HIKGQSVVIDMDEPVIKAFNHPALPVIVSHTETPVHHMNWGLIPPWAHSLTQARELQKMTLNAKIETARTKPAFKQCLEQRCVLPVTAFFEWQTQGKTKIPYQIVPSKWAVFLLAGLYHEWQSSIDGSGIKSFTLLTTEANDLMADIHNTKKRMPVIIEEHQLSDWLGVDQPAVEIESFISPLHSNLMHAHALERPSGSQLSLF
ncbi:MAG TPA: SOS response-associated peptidase, partial [Luteibaculaceae bacterium]|nr:SOS response-associated peptidase [Luteibaculaceae bacterium]